MTAPTNSVPAFLQGGSRHQPGVSSSITVMRYALCHRAHARKHFHEHVYAQEHAQPMHTRENTQSSPAGCCYQLTLHYILCRSLPYHMQTQCSGVSLVYVLHIGHCQTHLAKPQAMLRTRGHRCVCGAHARLGLLRDRATMDSRVRRSASLLPDSA